MPGNWLERSDFNGGLRWWAGLIGGYHASMGLAGMIAAGRLAVCCKKWWAVRRK
jgi:hypothetical protein